LALEVIFHQKEKIPSENLIILIHGLGASETTWVHNNVSWIDLFLTDPSIDSIDIAEVRYDTSHLANGLLALMGVKKIKISPFKKITVGKGPHTNLEILARELKREIDSTRIKKYKNIVLIGHSMGGLIAIRYILEEFESNNQPNNIKGLISLATPYNGSSTALFSELAKVINRHAQIPSLVPNSNFLDEIIRLWQKHLDRMNISFKFFFGTNDNIVPENSAIPHIVTSKWTGGVPLPGDHSGILKVDDHNSTNYIHVSEVVKEILMKDIKEKKKNIDEQRKLIIARLIARLKANGLEKEEAEYILKQEYNFEYLLPKDDKRLIVVVGEFGIGKSFAIDKIYLDLLKRAENELNFPLPLRLNAAQLNNNVQSFLESIILDDVKEYWIFVDGMDEVPLSFASNILENMRIAVERWKNIRIILTSRPLSILNDINEKIYMRGLREEEVLNLINYINNKNRLYHLNSFPIDVKEAVRRPLFAILLGIYLRNNNSLIPNTSGDLLGFLIEKSLEKIDINDSNTQQLLMKLAVKTTSCGNIPVKKFEVGDIEDIKRLLNSGIVIEDNGYISFVLPILSQWFAAKAISEDLISIDQIIENNNIEYWKYPLIILMSIFKEKKNVDVILRKIVESDPGFAAILIEEGTRKWGIHNIKNPLSAFECGKKIKMAMTSWVKSLDILSEIIAPVDKNRNVLPIGVKKDDIWLTTSWYRGNNKIPEINLINNENFFMWNNWRSARPGNESNWYWRWTLEELRDNLNKIIQNKALPICTEIIYKELMWSTTLKIVNKGSLFTKCISINEIKSRLKTRIFNEPFIKVDNSLVPTSMYIDYITSLEEKGIDIIECPLPGEDIENPKDNYVWSFYSDKQLYLRTIKIYENVVIGYKEIVETFFPYLKKRMKKYVLYPFLLKGEFRTPKNYGGNSIGPTLCWYLEPLPTDKSDFILDIEMLKGEKNSNFNREELFNELYEKTKKYRPDESNWMNASIRRQVLDIFCATPVTNIIYEWLKDDLKSINWIK
jgi:predicted esterase